VLDQVAAEREREVQVLVGEGVGEALGDVGGLRARAAFDPGSQRPTPATDPKRTFVRSPLNRL
jgi:hypothetical protein